MKYKLCTKNCSKSRLIEVVISIIKPTIILIDLLLRKMCLIFTRTGTTFFDIYIYIT